MCHCRAGVSWNACQQLGRSTERRSSAKCCVGLVGSQKKTNLKTLLGEHASGKEGWLVLRNHQNFMIHQKALYLCSMPKDKNEDLLLFVVPKAHWSPLWRDVIKMQDIRAVTVPCPYCRSAFGGQGWPARCGNLSGPAHAVYSMRMACPRPPYTSP